MDWELLKSSWDMVERAEIRKKLLGDNPAPRRRPGELVKKAEGRGGGRDRWGQERERREGGLTGRVDRWGQSRKDKGSWDE